MENACVTAFLQGKLPEGVLVFLELSFIGQSIIHEDCVQLTLLGLKEFFALFVRHRLQDFHPGLNRVGKMINMVSFHGGDTLDIRKESDSLEDIPGDFDGDA